MLFIFISKSTTHLVLAKVAPRGLEPSLDLVVHVEEGSRNNAMQCNQIVMGLDRQECRAHFVGYCRPSTLFLQEHIPELCANALGGSNRECQEVLQVLRKLLREHVESCGNSRQKNSGTQNVRGASRRILCVSRISSYTSKVCSICQHEAATDSDNDVRFLAPNGKDFRIHKILA